MSNLDSFILFPLLALALRLMIWKFTLTPQLIPLMPQAYGRDEDPSAIPYWIMEGRLPPDPGTHVRRRTYSARFTSSCDDLSHATLQVSRESRHFAFSQGYRVWKMHDRQGRTKDVIWNPAVDIILFPATASRYGQVAVHSSHWLRLFAAQYHEEAEIANNIAMHTSLFPRGTPLSIWLLGQLAKFLSMRKLIMVVDKEYERYQVMEEIQSSEGEAWNIPQDIEEVIRTWKQRRPESQLAIPDVRVVEDVDGILKGQSLQICLMCRPCEFLGIS
jgi:2EXR family